MGLKAFNKEKEYKKLQRNNKVKVTYITSLFSVCIITIIVAIVLANSFAFKSEESFILTDATVAELFEYQNFTYTGNVQEFTVPYTGYYNIELWGARGSGTSAGYGGYTKGAIYLEKDEVIYIYVGAYGNSAGAQAWNGGGAGGQSQCDYGRCQWVYVGSGGGATDVRITSGAWNDATSLRSRIMVAAGGGGGGGYYGGGGGYGQYAASYSGGGGSSFISGYAGVNAITSASSGTHTYNTNHYSGKYFLNGNMEAGINSGNGKATITYVSSSTPQRTNTKLDNVRYIKSCKNTTSTASGSSNIWVELQAIKDGINVAKEKAITGTGTALEAYTKIVDGNIASTASYGNTTATGINCITIDLGQEYDLDEIVLWNHWSDGRKYNDNTLSVGATNVSGTTSLSTIFHNYPGTTGYAETSQGRRYTAWD